jgi:hypothetical protein
MEHHTIDHVADMVDWLRSIHDYGHHLKMACD